MNATIEALFSLTGKTALVTGASGGIGRALAVGLAGAGATVGLHGRSEVQLSETAAEIARNGGKSALLIADLKDREACAGLIGAAKSALGRLDILVNCAGMNRRKPIRSVSDDDFDTIVDVNLRAPFFLSQAAQPVMKAQGGGKIIHIGSLTCFVGLGHVSVYGVTKSALAQLTKTQAVEWAPDNIQVNCLAPGFIKTPLTDVSLWQKDHQREWMLSRTPAKRPGTPEDLIGATLFMAGAGSAFFTGQTITVDGGVLAGGSWEDTF